MSIIIVGRHIKRTLAPDLIFHPSFIITQEINDVLAQALCVDMTRGAV